VELVAKEEVGRVGRRGVNLPRTMRARSASRAVLPKSHAVLYHEHVPVHPIQYGEEVVGERHRRRCAGYGDEAKKNRHGRVAGAAR